MLMLVLPNTMMLYFHLIYKIITYIHYAIFTTNFLVPTSNANYQYSISIKFIQQKMEKKSSKQIKVNLTEPQSYDFFILKELSQIQKSLFSPNIYLWIDQNIHNKENQQVLALLNKNQINPILCSTVEQAQQSLTKNPKDRFRIISSAALGEQTCKQFNSNQQVIHIYIFCGNETAGQALQQKWNKIKFYTVDVKQFLIKIKDQSKYDNRFSQLPNFMKITTKDDTQDNTLINKSRYNLHGLFLFKDRMQAKLDFLKLAKYFYQDKSKTQLQQFFKEYPVAYNHQLALNWYTKQTFFYKLLNNFLRKSSNPLQTPYLRLPFDATFKAIKQIYDQGKQNKKTEVYRGGYINDKQLEYLENNVGQYIEMFGFMSTSTSIDIANGFIKNNNGNSLIRVVIEDQSRQKKINYGYVNITKYSEFNQSQVLFNALNVFKVVCFKKHDKIHDITLKYGQLARMVKLGQGKVDQKQKKILINYKHQQEIISKEIHNQGDVFKYCQLYDFQVQYRQKYLNENKNKQNLDLAHQLHKMGSVYDNKSQYNKALEYYQKSLKILRNIVGENHSNTAMTLSNIGNVYSKKAKYDNALQFYQRALKININLFGQDNLSTSAILQNIGIVHRNKGSYKKALSYFLRSFKIHKNILGPNHSSTALTLSNIGNAYQSKKQYNKALQYYQKSLKIKIVIFGENHSSTAITLQNIGTVYEIKAQFENALQYYQRSLKININIFGENHESTAATLQKIGTAYKNKEQFNKALSYYMQTLKIKKNLFGENHSSFVVTLQNIALLYTQNVKYAKALEFYQVSLKINKKLFGENHHSTANTLNSIGNVYLYKGQYNNALQYYYKSLNINRNLFGQNHESTLTIIRNIEMVYQNQNGISIVLDEEDDGLQFKIIGVDKESDSQS